MLPMVDNLDSVASAISAYVMPEAWRYATFSDHDFVSMAHPTMYRNRCQRPFVARLRENNRMENIGARVRRIREAKRIERKDLARSVGLSYSGLSDLESGKAKSTTKLHRLASALDVSADYLETGREVSRMAAPSAEPTSRTLNVDYATLSETAQTLHERFGDAAMVCDLIERNPALFMRAYELYADYTKDNRTPEQERALAMKLADLTPQGAHKNERGTQVPAEGTVERRVGPRRKIES